MGTDQSVELQKIIDEDLEAARRLLEQALPHDQAALRDEPLNPTYQRSYRLHRTILAEVLGSLGDPARAADAADKIARLGYDPAEDSYAAACVVAGLVRGIRDDQRLTEAEREELARTYADRAMAHLRTAVRPGKTSKLAAHCLGDGRRIGSDLLDDRRNDSLALLDQRDEEVLGEKLGMALAVGELLRRNHRLLGFLGVLVDVHGRVFALNCRVPISS